MGPGIIIPLVLLAVVVPVALMWARKLKAPVSVASDADTSASSARLTSTALRLFPAPPWRVVYEIAADRLGGVGHVVIGPAGVFALQTTMTTLPSAPTAPDPQQIAHAAITRGALDDALRRCAMSSDRLVTVHWGAGAAAPSVELLPGATAVDGRSLTDWAAALPGDVLTQAQIDLAWQMVTTAIGRPDPLT